MLQLRTLLESLPIKPQPLPGVSLRPLRLKIPIGGCIHGVCLLLMKPAEKTDEIKIKIPLALMQKPAKHDDDDFIVSDRDYDDDDDAVEGSAARTHDKKAKKYAHCV